MKIRTMRYYLSEAFTSFWRNSFMSIASIATVAVSFFILGLFLIMVANLDYFADNLENQVQISVYLKDDLTTDQVMSVGSRLKALPDVKELEFTNKDQDHGQTEGTDERPAGHPRCLRREKSASYIVYADPEQSGTGKKDGSRRRRV